MKIVNKLLVGLTGLMIMVLIVSTVFFSVAYHDNFYKQEFEANNITDVTGETRESLNGIIEHTIVFLKGEKASFAYTLEDGSQAFGEREIMHMDDVVKLFDVLRYIQMVALVSTIVLAAYFIYQARSYNVLGKLFLSSVVWSIVFAAAIGILASTDFTSAFTQFHEIFFTNDLWLLDPNTDLLIQMLPEVFFFNFVKQFATSFLVVTFVTGIAGWYLFRKQGKNA